MPRYKDRQKDRKLYIDRKLDIDRYEARYRYMERQIDEGEWNSIPESDSETVE